MFYCLNGRHRKTNLCYTRTMTADQHSWQAWADTLHRWGVRDLVADLLEAAGPLTILGAQAIYLSQPLFSPSTAEGALSALARLLENPPAAQAFVAFLRETSNGERQ